MESQFGNHLRPRYGVVVGRENETSVWPCARSEIPGWHDRALYPLAGRRAAPPDFFLALAVAPSTASYGVASTTAGSHQEGDGPR